MTWLVLSTYAAAFVAGAYFGPKAINYAKQAVDWVKAHI